MIDAGLSFPEQELFGIDYLIPNLDYLRKNKQDVYKRQMMNRSQQQVTIEDLVMKLKLT